MYFLFGVGTAYMPSAPVNSHHHAVWWQYHGRAPLRKYNICGGRDFRDYQNNCEMVQLSTNALILRRKREHTQVLPYKNPVKLLRLYLSRPVILRQFSLTCLCHSIPYGRCEDINVYIFQCFELDAIACYACLTQFFPIGLG